jgi:uncharacterized lipoprotein YddW (UPF0748 family)
MPPPEPREFRAAWVATVANIDWPSRSGLSGAVQRREVLALLDRARTLNLNAIVLQVRPSADAIYPSALEPWAEFLSGEQGKPPWGADEAAWDPLAFWVQEAHRRGLELHAWFNPYRARHSLAKSAPAAPHLAVTKPELVRRYGEMLWLDPGEPAAAAHTLAVVLDVVRRYDIDGVHIDDYFYPYPVSVEGVEQPFPDDGPWARAQLAGAEPGRDAWRRANVNSLVKALHEAIHQAKPTVRFGISPFGLGRPDRRTPDMVGFSQYDKLFADVEFWLQEGWLDYLAPQLYWQIEKVGQAFPVLLNYWVAANAARPAARGGPRHLWPGLFTSQVRANPAEPPSARAWPAREVLEQVQVLRRNSHSNGVAGLGPPAPVPGPGPAAPAGTGAGAGAAAPGATGHIHFSMAALMQDRDGVATLLSLGAYAQAALPPATPWLDATPPPAPRLARGVLRAPNVQTPGPAAPVTPAAAAPAGAAGATGAAAATGAAVAANSPLRILPPEGRHAAPLRHALWRRTAGVWRMTVLGSEERLIAAEGADAIVLAALSRTGVLSPRVGLRWP